MDVPGEWAGWSFGDGYLIDPDGNRYSPFMVKSSFFTMELAHELTGSPTQIVSLKQRLIQMTSPKVITIELQVNHKSVILSKVSNS